MIGLYNYKISHFLKKHSQKYFSALGGPLLLVVQNVTEESLLLIRRMRSGNIYTKVVRALSYYFLLITHKFNRRFLMLKLKPVHVMNVQCTSINVYMKLENGYRT